MENQREELETKIKRLIQKDTFKTEWLARISHDFKETFSSLIWITKALEDESISKEDFFNLLPRVKLDAEKNLQSMADTSEWLKITDDQFEIIHSKIRVLELFKDLENSYRNELESKNIQLVFEGDKKLVYTSDYSLNFLLFKKILHNAIKYSHHNSVIIFWAQMEKGKPKFTISDRGLGMSKENLETCFSFQNALFQGTDGEIGIGFGLKIAQEIVYLLQGKIEIVTQEHLGTTVSVFLP